ncbi:hypothetical protein BKA64DRAFT_741938 [Cadophora sp. MPI-SDFR-AT-0126]|nr:hypothetical protein BKA64DRAFT_741938 [Leotiomycetes sp. MPI-SDFR-AT-0126]
MNCETTSTFRQTYRISRFIPILPKKHRPPKIPNELWHKIFDLLSIPDVKAVRVTCKLWSAVGAHHLFPTFRFSLRRRDCLRFDKARVAGTLLNGTKELHMKTDKTGIFWISESLAMLYHTQQLFRSTHSTAKLSYSDEVAKTRTLAEYAEWNVIAHENNNDFRDVSLLVGLFASLPSLDSIYITRRSPRVQNFDLIKAWNLCRHADYFQRAVSEFESLLLALNHSNIRIKNLSHDQLPVTFFRMDFLDIEQLTRPLAGLQSLHLTFDATEPPKKCSGFG